MIAGFVVGNLIDDDAKAKLVGGGDQTLDVARVAKVRFDIGVVRDVISGVILRRGVER